MDKLLPPAPLNLIGNLAENWRKFKQQFQIYETATGNDQKDDKIRSMTFLHVVDPESLEIYNTFTWADQDDKLNLTAICEQFAYYCNPRRNVTYERHVFNTRNQRDGEKFDAYVTELRNKASTCEFDTLREGLIRDRIVWGINSDSVRSRLLREKDLPLQKFIDICRASEASGVHLKELSDEKTVHAMNHGQGARHKYTHGAYRDSKPPKKLHKSHKSHKSQLNQKENISQAQKPPPQWKCKYCGKSHQRGPKNCPAYGTTCGKCKRWHHITHMCLQDARNVHVCEYSDSDSESDSFFIGTVMAKSECTTPDSEWLVDVKINKTKVRIKIDSGAHCNVVPKYICEKAGVAHIRKTRAKLVSYTGHRIKTRPTLLFDTVTNITSLSAAIPVLGLHSSVELGLIQRVCTAEKKTTTDELKDKRSALFKGIGCLPGEHKIETDETVPPVVQPPRRIPHTLRDKVKAELLKMEDMNKVEQPTKWVNPIVVVRKPTGDIRICLDPRNLNKAIKREHYPLKTAEDVAASLKSAKMFTEVDASSGFYQIKLAEESRWLTTFNTPFGRYKFERVPFGITSAPEVFQRTLSHILENFEGCDVIIDDILVWGSNEDEHNDRLE
ncbi:uncharacterized protein K02A2.6-like [Mizuhopecten yessoensis]|uniref:uncharacterized protein K02A2.6-like n=1 Tax=Mizuhopecten yessoensis TaxID=6573 RepID=UPI000B45A8BE|nr:uncharacterized protein K02A2.6-like [Mizuhopecten yessoensis]